MEKGNMSTSTLSHYFSGTDERLPVALSIGFAGALFFVYLLQPGNTLPVYLVLASLLSLLAAWLVLISFMTFSQSKGEYILTVTGFLAYALMISASAVWIGLQELALGISGGASFVVLSGTLTPILTFLLFTLQNFRQFTD